MHKDIYFTETKAPKYYVKSGGDDAFITHENCRNNLNLIFTMVVNSKECKEEIQQVIKTCDSMFVFESNSCEHVGLSERETKEIIHKVSSEDLNWKDFDTVRTRLKDVLPDLDDGMDVSFEEDNYLRGRKEILQHYFAYRYLIEQDQLTEAVIKQTHALLMLDSGETVAGVYRKIVLCVGDEGNPGYHLFPSHESIPALMVDFLKFVDRIRNDGQADLVNYRVACSVSYNFVAIHPFEDGNGRMSRLLLNYILIKSGLAYPLSLGLSKHKERNLYYRSLQVASKRGTLGFYQFFVLRHLNKLSGSVLANLKLQTTNSYFDH
eukprot:TRINITY_DN2037_c0_g1_i1.p1 TRINITY_DN2037_c0_g1~~TRINITY_DN2037_c0_g1_i1.p1  ORF type:complete len:321 (-),score=21.84 TRINITY_DN2037_c0_g1_i1:208-1170(-)